MVGEWVYSNGIICILLDRSIYIFDGNTKNERKIERNSRNYVLCVLYYSILFIKSNCNSWSQLMEAH